ncbi:hypothetical protein ACUNV4_08710 [Granulosicoccus sp. 3-233]|uniref:hypothetical protein n=1 Tax=Granulosicoccus sp. 3-233 TaxID=3417969 RepID=UPI003D330E66
MNHRVLALQGCLLLMSTTGKVLAADRFQVRVEGNTLSWGNATHGYLQVQSASDWTTMCEYQVYTLGDTPSGNRDGTACEVSDGSYHVINHSTRQRIQGIVVGDIDAVYTAPPVETIDNVWVVHDPYLGINAADVMSQLNAIPAPQDLHAQVYSPTAAELFWTRAAIPGLQYDIYLGEQRLGSSAGTSLYLDGLTPGTSLQLRVRARDSSGAVSRDSQLSLTTLDDASGSAGGTEQGRQTPENLTVAIYSDSVLELFWARQRPGQMFQISRNAEVLGVTDGTSYLDGDSPAASDRTYAIVAIDEQGRQSSAASIQVPATTGTVTPPVSAAITLANAEQVLREIIAIANRKPFEVVEAAMQRPHEALKELFINYRSAGVTTANGLTLVPGSTEIPGGSAGGDYSCDAGGSASLPIILGGGDGQGYVSTYSDCSLPTGIYSGQVQLYPASRGPESYYKYEGIEVQTFAEDQQYFYDSEQTRTMPYRDGVRINDSWTVEHYENIAADGSITLAVHDFTAEMGRRVGLSFAEPITTLQPTVMYRDSSSDISFDADIPAVSDQRLSVNISLRYEGDTEAEEPLDQWTEGSISVTAADGSSVIATPVPDDTGTIRMLIGDDVVDVPVDDELQVEVFVSR